MCLYLLVVFYEKINEWTKIPFIGITYQIKTPTFRVMNHYWAFCSGKTDSSFTASRILPFNALLNSLPRWCWLVKK